MTRKHSSRVHTACFSDSGGGGLPTDAGRHKGWESSAQMDIDILFLPSLPVTQYHRDRCDVCGQQKRHLSQCPILSWLNPWGNKNAFQLDAYRPLFTIRGVSLVETPADRVPHPRRQTPVKTLPLQTSFVGGKNEKPDNLYCDDSPNVTKE